MFVSKSLSFFNSGNTLKAIKLIQILYHAASHTA